MRIVEKGISGDDLDQYPVSCAERFPTGKIILQLHSGIVIFQAHSLPPCKILDAGGIQQTNTSRNGDDDFLPLKPP